MKVKKLKNLLKNLPDDMEIILQKDAEGNGFSPLYEINSKCVYIAETTYHGYVYDMRLSADKLEVDESEWQELNKKSRVLILSPVN